MLKVGMLLTILISALVCVYFIKLDWRKYGFLYISAAVSANVLCYLFTWSGLYSFPNNLLHGDLLMPIGLVSTAFPLVVLLGVRFSPEKWIWKIPFYWGIVHLGMVAEAVLMITPMFKFGPEWDLWDSYSLRWGYYLLFELLGSKIIPPHLRKPISHQSFRYGGWAWIVFHIVVVVTIFLMGVYTGITLF
ncbi:hypothetical protein GWK91_16480 [Virgibacillus sp. MSP4-1]|uniref:CBO0543 family protein n=1 Tax=Virgibacillus sp. MSP4-1 TaxID=2700081 RepID=UPI00137BF22F|nr:CBO0543 family protein [Virgibacillus sp. MSP4-1]QHS24375.1 hypothetical protein GWK91_16480 [Virgibacillus sp. MSP4-1]